MKYVVDIVLVLRKETFLCCSTDKFMPFPSCFNLFCTIILHTQIRIVSQFDLIRPQDPHFHNTTLIPTNNILNRIRITRRCPPDGCSISRIMLQVRPSLRSRSRVGTRRSNLSLDGAPRPHYRCIQNRE